MSARYREQLELSLDPGLSLGPGQVWGTVRLVPVLRREAIEDLRLSPVAYGGGAVALPDKITYSAYMPQALVVSFGDAARPVGETSLGAREIGRALKRSTPLRSMVRKLGPGVVRFLPQHVAMEGLLALHFGGPDVAYDCWSEAALAPRALSPRWERVAPGESIPDLKDALRLFERHDDQVGVLVYVADALAAATIVGHPADYARLHRSLIEDFYGRTIWRYGLLGHTAPEHLVQLNGAAVNSLDDLRAELAREEREWLAFRQMEAASLFGRTARGETVRRLGDYRLQRFLTGFEQDADEHIGEVIRRRDGAIAWLKTYRLDREQTRRVALLDALAGAGWELAKAARARGVTVGQFRGEMERAELGYLFKRAAHVGNWRG